MTNRAQYLLILACVAGAVVFVGYEVFRAGSARTYPLETTFTERARLGEFASNGVRVVVFLDTDSHGQPLLRADFSPVEPGFHLYSQDLDPKSAGGFGMATRFELLPHSLVRTAGRPFTDIVPRSHYFKDLNATLDIYPDGPVNLRLPIQFIGKDTTIAAQVAVSYMACKTDGICRQPIERRILNLRIQRSDLPATDALGATSGMSLGVAAIP